LDLTLAATDPAYLTALQGYHAALAGRNALLKREGTDAQLGAFEQPLARHAAGLVASRRQGLDALAREVTAAYAVMADGAEPVALEYAPDLAEREEAAWLSRWQRDRARDRQLRATATGPHRDDFTFALSGRPAAVVGSEGQQRCLVLALRLAQAAWFRRHLGAEPVLLADDVLGDLDPERRARFWSVVSPSAQVLATGTSLPVGRDVAWQVWRVEQGKFRLMA
jgi:DNA replication and repair protein RecF